MNVSISAVVKDLHTTASGVQSAIALEALISAAFILINSKLGDLMGRKRAYVIGLLAYAVGALAMTVTQSLRAGDHLLGDHRRARRLAAAAGHAVAHPRQLHRGGAEEDLRAGRRLGGDRRCHRSAPRRVRDHVPVVARGFRARGGHHPRGPVADPPGQGRPYTGPRKIDLVGAALSVVGMGASFSASWCGRRVVATSASSSPSARSRLPRSLVACRAQASRKPALIDPDSVQALELPHRRVPADAAADHARRRDDRSAAVPADDAGVQRHGSRARPRAAVALDVRRGDPGWPKGGKRRPANLVLLGFTSPPSASAR